MMDGKDACVPNGVSELRWPQTDRLAAVAREYLSANGGAEYVDRLWRRHNEELIPSSQNQGRSPTAFLEDGGRGRVLQAAGPSHKIRLSQFLACSVSGIGAGCSRLALSLQRLLKGIASTTSIFFSPFTFSAGTPCKGKPFKLGTALATAAVFPDLMKTWRVGSRRACSSLRWITITGGCVLVRLPINFEEDCKVAGEQLKAAVSVQRAHSHNP